MFLAYKNTAKCKKIHVRLDIREKYDKIYIYEFFRVMLSLGR